MDALVSAISGLAVAMVALGGMLWKLQRINGHQQNEGLELLREIKGIIHSDAQERREMRQEMSRQFQGMAEALAYLRGRQGQE